MKLQPNQTTTYLKKTTELSLKYSYPGLWTFKTSFYNMGTRYKAKLGCYRSRSHKSVADVHPQNSIPGKDTRLKTTQAFFINTCELYVTS